MYQALFHKIHESKASLLIIKLKDLLANIDVPSENEHKALQEDRSWEYYKKPEHEHELEQYYCEYENAEDRRLLFDFYRSGLTPVTKNGLQVLADTSSKYYNVVNNLRVTTDTPQIYKQTVYMFGHCNAVGCFAEDKLTLASQLQRKFNSVTPKQIRVVNAANWLPFEGTARQILSPRYNFLPGDLVIILSHTVEQTLCEKALERFQSKSFYTYYDLSKIFQRPHEYGEVLFDNLHMSHKGYAILAQHLFDIAAKLMEAKKQQLPPAPAELTPYINYLSMLRSKRGSTQGNIGAVVMNCNPFTLGHKYLVTEALKRCDYLYVFILDEDKSFFKFDDRITMVKVGLKEFKNISVVPSGKIMISSETMPEYFNKEEIQNIKVDTSYDLALFSAFIAPALNITKRFAGSEPFCPITNQYNAGMRETLPRYGIEFIELPRYALGQKEISASLARKYITDNKNAELKKIVPQSTYDFLLQKGYIQG